MAKLIRFHGMLLFLASGGFLLLVILVALSITTLVSTGVPSSEESNLIFSDAESLSSSSSILLSSSSISSSSRKLRSTTSKSSVLPSYRLKTSMHPEKYFLTITPILEPGFEETLGEQWFAPGNVVITATAVKAVKTVTLHAKNITVHNVTVFQNGRDRDRRQEKVGVPVNNISFHERHGFMKIELQNSLVPEHIYEISIVFTAYVSEVLSGLFRSSYRNEDTGQEEWFAATHMEALHARQMFPCFDEPAYKAVIQAKIGRREHHVALFNTESTGNETMLGVDGWIWESFAPTVKMSTYLTALVVGKFQYAEAPGILLPETRVRTYAPPHFVTKNAAQYAADVAEKVLHTYGEYFKEPYPMAKFDSVAIPSFLYGAMENYGLSIFRETLLLNFANKTSEAVKYTVTNVICHEIGHQWAGNLVSPDWWTHLWLSEGLTKYTEYIGLNATIPEFEPWDIFISESLQLGLRLDADQKTSHSLKIDDDAWPLKSEMEWFDEIAYKKGGSLIRMMQGFLTEPVLRKGLIRYLNRLKYDSAIQDDLFSDCDKEAQLAHKLPENTNLQQVMSGWTLQSGFPLLKVTLEKNNKSSGTADKILVSQEKYYTSRTQRLEASSDKQQKWFIPVSVATTRHPNFDPQPEFWLRNNESSVALTLPTNSWLILNAGTTGFFRVIYDEELTNRINDQLMEFPQKIDKLARSQLIDDYFNAAWNRYLPIERALNLTRYMKDHAETEHVVWTSILTMLKLAYRLFRDSPDDLQSFKAYMLPRIEKAILATGGFAAINTDSKGLPVIRHAQLLDWACSLESPECTDYAVTLVKSWKSTDDLSVIPRDFRQVVIPAAVANDPSEGGELFNFVLEKYRDILGNDDGYGGKLKEQLLTAVSSTRDSDKIMQLLDMALEPGGMSSGSDAVNLLQNLGSNPKASDIILEYFVDNHGKIFDDFGSISPITVTAKAMTPHLKSLSGLFLIEKLVKSNETLFKNSFSPVINRIRANIIWYDDFGEHMLDFFDKHK